MKKEPRRVRRRDLAVWFAIAQLADVAWNELVPQRFITAHLDHLRVPRRIQSTLVPIKVLGAVGLLLGVRWPRLGALTSACLVGYYAAAVGFHLNAPEHPILAVPAGAYGVGAATALLAVYLPEIRSATADGRRTRA